jgi:hypothetical protein
MVVIELCWGENSCDKFHSKTHSVAHIKLPSIQKVLKPSETRASVETFILPESETWKKGNFLHTLLKVITVCSPEGKSSFFLWLVEHLAEENYAVEHSLHRNILTLPVK